jgi:prolyl oligopeptidase
MSLTGSPLAPVEEMIHGVLVRDPYRWLEDRSLPETDDWIREQQRHCDEYLSGCKELPLIRERVRKYLDIDIVDQPAKVRDRYFFRRRTRGQQQACIYVRDAVTESEHLLVDPSDDGPFVAVGIHQISADGALLAYERKEGGEDRKSIHIVDTVAGAALSHNISRGYARGFIFSDDSRGFFFCQEHGSDENEHAIRFQVFDKSTEDQIIFRAERSRNSRLILIADSLHLGAIYIHEMGGETVEDFWMAKQVTPRKWHRVFSNRPTPFVPILKNGNLFALSYESAPNGKFVELNQSGDEARTIVPDQGAMIRQLGVKGDFVSIVFLQDLNFSVRNWSVRGQELGRVDLPGEGTIRMLADFGYDKALFFSHESFSQPLTVHEYDPSSSALRAWGATSVQRTPRSVEVKSHTYRSADGTEIPITLVGDRRVSGSGFPVAVVMTAYGGFGVPMTARFSVLITLLLECGVVFALPNIRGGGEFGRTWHRAAIRGNRQVAFDDFLAAAEWLCKEKITTQDQLGIFGGSNSGLLVGVALTQRPDLFRAVLCIAPLLDMIRYERFDQAAKWVDEYGTCEIIEEFHALRAYSPYHAIEDSVNYPAVLFVTGDKDDRCAPAHVRKMAARLLERSAQANPVLIDYQSERGHSPVLPLEIRIDAIARRVAFFCRELKLAFNDGEAQ